MRQPFFSIVIPTLNEEKFLPQLLDCLSSQSFRDFEVVHVDAGSKDKTNQIIKRYDDRLDIKHIVSKKQNVSTQRNLGAEKSTGEWIIFMDADVKFNPDFLLTVRYKIAVADRKRRSRFDVFNNLITLSREDKKKTKHQVTAKTINLRLRSSADSTKPLVMGAMLGVRAEWIKKIQFNEAVKFAEDICFVKDLVDAGAEYKLLRTPTYQYSMRRWDDDGLLKNAAKATKLELKILNNEYNDTDYNMSGGSKY